MLVLTLLILIVVFVPIIQHYKSKTVMNLYFSSERWSKLKLRYNNYPVHTDCALLLGDSMTENFEKHISNPHILNFGISGDFSSGLIQRIHSVVKQQPKQIFIMIGINDLIEKVPVLTIKKKLCDCAQSATKRMPRIRNICSKHPSNSRNK